MRFSLVSPQTIQMRESAGLVKDIYDPTTSIRQPLSEYQTMLDLIHRDPTISTAYDIITDFATYRGLDAIGGKVERRNDLRSILYDKLNFSEVLPNLVRTLCYYGDGFLEARRSGSNPPYEVWPLETTEMRISYDIHGRVEGYVQRPFRMEGLSQSEVMELEGTAKNPNQGIFFGPDDVMHFRMKWLGSQVYSYNPNAPIGQVASTKLYAGNYLMNVFLNMPPKYVAHLAGISPTDYGKAVDEFRSTKTNYKKSIAFTRSSDPASKLTMQKLDVPYDETLINIMKWLNNEILKVTRVPRSWIEESGTENRGVTEAEQRPFDVKIKAIHRNVLEPVFNRKLLPMLGFTKKPSGSDEKILVRFNEISNKGEKEILMNVGLLRNMGLKPEAVVKYLDERGILGIDPADFETEQLEKSMELNPSRARENKSTDSMTSKLDSQGVSADGAKKMEATAE